MQASTGDSEKSPRLSEALLSFARQWRIDLGLIARLMRECEPFREVCADYEECCAKLLSLETKGVAAAGQVRDHTEMREELGRELRRRLVEGTQPLAGDAGDELSRPESKRASARSNAIS